MIISSENKTKKTITAFDERVLMAHMSALVLKLEGHAHVRTAITSDGQEVFSIINFIKLVC